ncbi:MAG: FAD-dependent oxidoreductase, partial [Verrucomicrobiota bacterium]
HDRHEIEALLDAGDNDVAIELLCEDSVPSEPWQLALLARAYFQRGDSRGDLYSGGFFLNRAREEGFDESWLDELARQYTKHTNAVGIRARQYKFGGMTDQRTEGATPYKFHALAVAKGTGYKPKDLHWSACNVPCQEACPAGTDIPEYLTAIFNREYERAYRINLESNVFPGVLGRVCARPCETKCRHGWDGLGDSVAICHSKRASAGLRKSGLVILDPWFNPSGKRIAVVGAGVAGLAAARELARLGHGVTVYEKHHRPGGMLNQGIPEFRLPRDVIDREIDQIRGMGVEIVCGAEAGRDIPLSRLRQDNDAVVMAAGTLRPNILNLPGKDLQGVRHGLDFLLEANEEGTAEIGRHVVVIGGGFTAMDCARTAKRLGAASLSFGEGTLPSVPPGTVTHAPPDHVRVWYRRTEKEMLITPGELEELRDEGIGIEFLVTPVAFLGEQGRVTAVRFIRTQLGAPDAGGRRRPEPIEDSEFEIPADTVLLATGQFPDTEWIDADLHRELVEDDGWLKSGENTTTAVDGLFVAGDFAQGASSLISAIGHARHTARDVDAFLMGRRRVADQVVVDDADQTGRIREMDAVPLQAMPAIALDKRDLTAEVETGYTADLAEEETQRCYRCHYKYEIDSDKCIYCDWCIKVKPRPECILRIRSLEYDGEGRIVDWEEAAGTDETYLIWINQFDCIRCGACVDVCPVDAISLQKTNRHIAPR